VSTPLADSSRRLRGHAARVPDSPVYFALLLAALAVAARISLVIDRFPAPLQADTLVYFEVADEIGDGNLFFRDVLGRTPGYAWFVLAADLLPLARDHAVVLVQHLIGVALTVAVFLSSWRLFGRVAAVLAGLLVATSPALIFLEDEPLPDFLFGVFVAAAAILLAFTAVRGSDQSSKFMPVILGAVIGAAALVKPAGQVLVLAPIPALAFAGWRGRRLLRDVLLVAGACLVVISPWIVHSIVRYGSPSLSPQGSLTLFHRVYEVDRRPIPQDSRDGRVAARAVAAHPELRIHVAAYEGLVEEYEDGREALAATGRLAREEIAEYPLTYAWDSITGVDRVLFEARSSSGIDDLLSPRVESAGLSSAVWGIGVALSDIWWLAALHGLAGLAAVILGSRVRRVAALALLSVWLAVALATVASHGGLGRYSLQLAPVTWMLTTAGISALLIAVVQGSRFARSRRSSAPAPESSSA
jgi:4-amino-4-deoxy-L-arabinose transferase-like glycosyltransferase